jgi:hypothetical protein
MRPTRVTKMIVRDTFSISIDLTAKAFDEVSKFAAITLDWRRLQWQGKQTISG